MFRNVIKLITFETYRKTRNSTGNFKVFIGFLQQTQMSMLHFSQAVTINHYKKNKKYTKLKIRIIKTVVAPVMPVTCCLTKSINLTTLSFPFPNKTVCCSVKALVSLSQFLMQAMQQQLRTIRMATVASTAPHH